MDGFWLFILGLAVVNALIGALANRMKRSRLERERQESSKRR